MDLEEMYRRRFNESDGRESVWRVLVQDFFQQYVRPDDVVLDMACGHCAFINNVVCARKIGVDRNSDAVKYARPDVEFITADSTDIPLDDASVDTVFISNFFEHLSRASLLETIMECHRILRSGGRVLVLQPNVRFAYRDYWMFLDHITPIDDRMLQEAFELNGFVLRKRIVRFLPYTTQSRLPRADFLVRLYLRVPIAWRILGKQSFLVFERD
jgi:ubiquinone/menaquinone biosynthesis C-methylase UbiE